MNFFTISNIPSEKPPHPAKNAKITCNYLAVTSVVVINLLKSEV